MARYLKIQPGKANGCTISGTLFWHETLTVSPPATPLSDTQIEAALQQLNATDSQSVQTSAKKTLWQLSQGKLSRQFVFHDFVGAVGFMMQVAVVAERMNHHPEWSNVYATVNVALTTHDSAGITDLDLELAQAMNRLAQPLLP